MVKINSYNLFSHQDTFLWQVLLAHNWFWCQRWTGRHLDHVRRDMLLSSVTCVFDHVAGCHVVFLFLEILRQESMFFARVKNSRRVKTRAKAYTVVPCSKLRYFLDKLGWNYFATTCNCTRAARALFLTDFTTLARIGRTEPKIDIFSSNFFVLFSFMLAHLCVKKS